MFDFLKNISGTEIIIVGIILIVFFGSKKIAGLGKVGGETVKEIKNIKKEVTGAIEEVKKEPATDEKKREEVSE